VNKLIKELNKYNGNLCFSAENSNSFLIFECNRNTQEINRQEISKKVNDICNISLNSYLLCFGDNYLGILNNGIVNEHYINTAIQSIKKIKKGHNSIYLLDNLNIIYKCEINPFSIIWSISLSNVNFNGDLITRNESLLYYDDQNIVYIGDLVYYAYIINHKKINNQLFLCESNKLDNDYIHVRWRQVYE
jgi:hypothetical protein